MLDYCTLSVLTWRAPRTLKNTLSSVAPFVHFFNECYVICQEADPLEIAISEYYGFKAIAVNANLGIQEGLAKCAEMAKTDLVLIIENDCVLTQPCDFLHTVADCQAAILDGHVEVIKLGTRSGGLDKRYEKYWGKKMPPKKTIWGYLRPTQAKSCSGNVILHPDFSSTDFNNVLKLTESLYVTSSEFVQWTNRAFIARKSFFLETIIEFARKNPARKKVNGKPDLEKEINCLRNRSWWRKGGFNIGLTRSGLFGHLRLDRGPEDEKS